MNDEETQGTVLEIKYQRDIDAAAVAAEQAQRQRSGVDAYSSESDTQPFPPVPSREPTRSPTTAKKGN